MPEPEGIPTNTNSKQKHLYNFVWNTRRKIGGARFRNALSHFENPFHRIPICQCFKLESV
jgi:hypothetical protein